MVEHRSVSQAKELLPEFDGCPYAYYLKRIAKDEDGNRLWQRPAAWFPQGLAVHETVEEIEKSDRTISLAEAERICGEAYDEHTNRLAEDTPNFSFWFRSGPYDGRNDIPRRYEKSKEQIGRYFEYMAKYPDMVPDVLDDVKAVELPFEAKFGDVEVVGVIDQVVKRKPVDVKSGNKPPNDQGLQLGTYAGYLKQKYDIEPSTGTFWMGKTGKMTVPYDLTAWTQEHLTDVYGRADEQIRAGEFDPDPEPSKCMFCSVSADCQFKA